MAYQIDGLSIFAHCSQGDVALGVDAGWAPLFAGGYAVRVVVRQKKLKSGFACFVYARGVCVDLHPFRHRGCAGWDEVRPAFKLHHAYKARAVRFKLRRIAKSRNSVELLSFDHFKNCPALFCFNRLSVYFYFYGIHLNLLSLVDGIEVAGSYTFSALGAFFLIN